jgi:hypothetical protein
MGDVARYRMITDGYLTIRMTIKRKGEKKSRRPPLSLCYSYVYLYCSILSFFND